MIKTLSIFCFLLLLTIMMNSCKKEDKSYKCTTYLNGSVWDETTVSDCSNCFAPSGYTVTCKEE